jgi:hypothetical protein
MELDDLKLAWQSLDRHLVRREAFDMAQYRERRVRIARAHLWPLVAGQTLQFISGVLLLLVAAGYWSAHIGEPHRVVVGVLLQAWGLMFSVCAGQELALVRRIDVAAPVLVVQRQLSHLRAWRLRIAPLFGYTGCVAWVPLVLWAFDAGLGVDLVEHAPRAVAVLASSAAVGAGVWWGFLRWLRQPRRAGLARSLDDGAAGPHLRRAWAELDELARFEPP